MAEEPAFVGEAVRVEGNVVAIVQCLSFIVEQP